MSGLAWRFLPFRHRHDRMSVFTVVHWWVWVAVFLFGAVLGLAAANLLAMRKPAWGAVRRTLVAAAITPCLILVVTGIGAYVAAAGSSADNWGYLAAASLIQVGLGGSLIAFVGGLAGAAASERLLSE